jgi:hypothetical protein
MVFSFRIAIIYLAMTRCHISVEESWRRSSKPLVAKETSALCVVQRLTAVMAKILTYQRTICEKFNTMLPAAFGHCERWS